LEATPDPEARARRLKDLAESEVEAALDNPDARQANAWLASWVKAVWCEKNQVVNVELI